MMRRKPSCLKHFKSLKSAMLCVVAVAALMGACSEPAPEWIEPGQPTAADAMLKVRTRGAEGDHAPALPIRIYAFDNAGRPVGAQTMTSAYEPIALPLAAGDYTLYAVTGADAARYDIPAFDNLTPGTAFALKTPYDTHGEVGAAHERIALVNGETLQLTLTVTRIVAQLTASLTNIPDDIAAVSVRIAPLYTGFTVGGAYTGDPGGAAIPLTKTAPGQWGTSKPLFMLPGTGNATITVALTGTAGTMEYAFASDVPLAANYKLHIDARYEAAPILDGSIIGTDWAGTLDIVFDFGPGTQGGGGNGSGTGGSESGGSGEPVAGTPAAGSIYRGCYVLSTAPAGPSSANLLLVAPRQWTDISGNNSAELYATTAAMLSTYSHDGLDGWRLPDYNEATLLCDALKLPSGALDAAITDNGPLDRDAWFIFSYSTNVCRFRSSDNEPLSTMPVSFGTYNMLAVRTLTVTVE